MAPITWQPTEAYLRDLNARISRWLRHCPCPVCAGTEKPEPPKGLDHMHERWRWQRAQEDGRIQHDRREHVLLWKAQPDERLKAISTEDLQAEVQRRHRAARLAAEAALYPPPPEPALPDPATVTHIAVGDTVGWHDRQLRQPGVLAEAWQLRGRLLDIAVRKLDHNDYHYLGAQVLWDDPRWPEPVWVDPDHIQRRES